MNSAKASLVQMRLLHIVFIGTQFLFMFMLTFVRPVGPAVQPAVVFAIGVAALADCGIALFFRRIKVKAPQERLRIQPDDVAALIEWRAGNILSFAFAEVCGLFGFVVKLLGAEWKVAGPFFALAILLLLLWTPRLDVAEAA